MRKKLSLNKETVTKLSNSEMNSINGGLIISTTSILEILANVTRGDCDIWSFGETDCPIESLRNTGRA